MAKLADHMRPVIEARDYISTHFGIHFTQARLGELSSKLDSLSVQMGYAKATDWIGALLSGSLEGDNLTRLIDNLTVGETYFFREPEAIEAIATTIIPAIAKWGERRMRIWVAGCATGEEAYTVAMFLHSRFPGLDEGTVSILATDINKTFLARAEKGVYGSWAFRAIPAHFLSRYFRECPDGRFELDETIRRMVRFERVNLVSGHFPSPRNGTQDCDLILCRNVLMYFAPETIRAIAARLARSLTGDGWLIVSQTECGDYFSACFDTVQSGNIFVYRKKSDSGNPTSGPLQLREPVMVSRSRRHEPAAKHTVPFQPPASARPPFHGLPPDGGKKSSLPERMDHEELFRQSRTLADGGKLEQALQCCEEGLGINALSLHGQYLRAVILLELGQLSAARSALRKVLYLNPDCVMATYTLATIEQKQGNRREAFNYFDKSARMLSGYDDDHLLPEAEGLTVGHLKEIINAGRKT